MFLNNSVSENHSEAESAQSQQQTDKQSAQRHVFMLVCTCAERLGHSYFSHMPILFLQL